MKWSAQMCQYRKTNVPVSENHFKFETKFINLLESTVDYLNQTFHNWTKGTYKYLATCWSETLRKRERESECDTCAVHIVHITNYKGERAVRKLL